MRVTTTMIPHLNPGYGRQGPMMRRQPPHPAQVMTEMLKTSIVLKYLCSLFPCVDER